MSDRQIRKGTKVFQYDPPSPAGVGLAALVGVWGAAWVGIIGEGPALAAASGIAVVVLVKECVRRIR